MTIPLLRRVSSAAVVLALTLALTACGGGDGEDEDDEPSGRTSGDTSQEGVVSEDDLTASLLTLEDLPEGFVEDPDEAEESEVFEGTCFENVDDFDSVVGTDPATEENASFLLESESGQQQVTSEISSYAADVALADAIQGVADDLATCTTVEATDDEGVVYALTLDSTTELSVTGAEQQVNITMRGTVTPSGGSPVPVLLGSVLTRVGNTISKVGTTEIASADGIVVRTGDLSQVQLGRLVDTIG